MQRSYGGPSPGRRSSCAAQNRKPCTGARQAAAGVLAQDPRPSYQRDPERIYGMEFAGLDVRFTVKDGVLRVFEVVKG